MTNETKTIYFDMDGTIADLYGVDNWLDYLIRGKTYPYENAKPLVNMQVLARYLNKLQKQGYRIGVISWGSKNATPLYLQEITEVKKAWLRKRLRSVKFDFIHVLPYGFEKETFCTNPEDILFDDEEKNRTNWNIRGKAYKESEIFEVLKSLLTA